MIPPDDALHYLAGLQHLAWYLSHTDSREDLEEAFQTLDQAWQTIPGRKKAYRLIRIRIRSARAVVRYRLGRLRPCHLRRALDVAHGQLCALGLYRDAGQLTAEAVELCADMRSEDAADDTIRTLCERLSAMELPGPIRAGLRELLRTVGGVAREPLRRAAAKLRRACSPSALPGSAGIG